MSGTRQAKSAPPSLAQWARLRGSGEAGCWWLGGVLYFKPPRDIGVPLLQVHGAGFARVESGDGEWRQSSRELALFGTLHGQDILDEWHNPLTGQRDRLAPLKLARTLALGADGTQHGEGISGRIERMVWPGGTAFFAERQLMTPAGDATGPLWLRLYEAAAADLDGDGYVAASGALHAVTPPPAWLATGGAPGHAVWHLSLRKLRDVAGLPAFLRTRIARDHDAFLPAAD